MKYGESAFDILYLLFAIVTGVSILRRRKDRIGTLLGSTVLILGIGDAFHLIPRVINSFSSGDYTAWAGVWQTGHIHYHDGVLSIDVPALAQGL